MLISSDRHRPEDLELWEEYEESDREYYRTHGMGERERAAREEVAQFFAETKGRFYVGVSWGKDSVVVAHLAQRVLSRAPGHRRVMPHNMPLVWVRVEPICNPHCRDVRDVYLRKTLPVYDEIEVSCYVDTDGVHATGTLESGFSVAAKRYGNAYVSGIRSKESGARALSRAVHGVQTSRTCRPIIDWPTEAVFAYLTHHNLPIHPNYAMLGGGRWDRNRIRVASLGGRRGDGMGRTEWEQEYYGDVLARLAKIGRGA